MKLWKAIVIGFIIYWVVWLLGVAIFVGGLGYKFPNLANTFAIIMWLPLDIPSGVHVVISCLFWTLIIAGILKLLKSKRE